MSVNRLRELREAYRKTPDGYIHELRLSFAEVVVDRLRELGWSQKTLSNRLGVTEPLVSRLLSGDHNWTSESAGRFLFALGVRARVQKASLPIETIENATEGVVWRYHTAGGAPREIKTERYSSVEAGPNEIKAIAVES